jgi:hypothetical protein
MFHCSVAPETAGSGRWLLRDSQGVRYVGPPLDQERTPESVRGAVNSWWAEARRR